MSIASARRLSPGLVRNFTRYSNASDQADLRDTKMRRGAVERSPAMNLSGVLCFALILAGAASPLPAAEALFPQAIHLTREVSDSLSARTTRIEEYCSGNRIVSITGAKTVIADYEKSELTEIDRVSGEYSVTSFETVARAEGMTVSRSLEKFGETRPINLMDRGSRQIRARSGEAYETTIEEARGKITMVIVVDSELELSRDALAVVDGAAWPQPPTREHEVVEAACERQRRTRGIEAASDKRMYLMPLEQTTTWELSGETVRRSNVVVRIGNEFPPPELIAVPPGARLVESRIVQRQKMLDDLDRLPSSGPDTKH